MREKLRTTVYRHGYFPISLNLMLQSNMQILGHSDSHVCSQMPESLSSAKVQSSLGKETKISGILKHKTALIILQI